MTHDGSNNGPKQIDLLPATTTVFRHTLHQRGLAVLDSAADRENSVTTVRRCSGSLEYVSTFLSDCAACRTRLCPRIFQMAQRAIAGGSARLSSTVDCDLSLPLSGPRTGSYCFTALMPQK